MNNLQCNELIVTPFNSTAEIQTGVSEGGRRGGRGRKRWEGGEREGEGEKKRAERESGGRGAGGEG